MAGEKEEKVVMPDSTNTTDDDKPVTDEELEAAYNAISGKETPVVEKKEEPVKEEVKVEEKVEEKKEEVPAVSPEFKAFQERIAALEAENEKLKGNKVEETAPTEEEEQFITNKNLPEILKKQREKEAQQAREADAAYSRAYEGELAVLAKTVDEDLFAEIFETLISNKGQNEFNGKPVGIPAADVRINFNAAKAKVFEKRAEKGYVKPNLATEKTNLPTGITINNREKSEERKPIQLDEHAAALIKNSGLTDEEIKEALEGPAQFVYARR